MMQLPSVEFIKDSLKGADIIEKTTRVSDLQGLYKNQEELSAMPQDTILYEVQAYLPVADGTTGGLFFGITKLNPGTIDGEYYFTKGHFHAISDRGEFYWGIEGEGMLLLMDRERNCRAEKVYPGSLHYIPGHTAHRVANTGNTLLSFGAAWPSDAGHDYEEIFKNGFSARLMNTNGEPTLVNESNL